ncbi:MATE family efflux transporter [Bacillus solitudinis]|uniref:MATE family efflux transporter n=1 Tax=Bacillus solitudinis TaxID=2014074 RepID=UPI000C242094|nr:MATE family efflux transporter [Bacillus solitudinis]
MKVATSVGGLEEKSVFSHRSYLVLAIPLMISTLTQPLLGIVDTAVIGRMPNPSYIGGVAVGALIFNMMYWLLGFLRVSTTGFTAQARGATNENEMTMSLLRPMVIAILFGFLFIILQYPLVKTALFLIGPSDAVTQHVATYVSIRIWSAPFALLCYVIIGWFMGMSMIKHSLAVQLSMNILNILLSIMFVLGFGFGVAGVAAATLISEVSAVLLGIWLIIRSKQITFKKETVSALRESTPLLRMLKMNRDLFFRTVCLLTMTGLFTAKGAAMGEVALAANAIILQIHYFMSYLFGGLANASSIITGQAIGSKNKQLFHRAFFLSAQWGGVAAVVLALTILVYGADIVSFFTTISEVEMFAGNYIGWMIIFSFVGFWGLQLEGIFAGATEARSVRDSIAMALVVFLFIIYIFVPVYGNHGIWMAFVLFSLSRSIFLSLFIPRLSRNFFSLP